MRSFSSKITSAITDTLRNETWLFEFQFDSSTLRLCNAGAVIWEGYTWQHSGAQMSNHEKGIGGTESCRITIPNHDRAMTAVFLANDYVNKPVIIRRLFGSAPYAVADAEIEFTGVMIGIPEIENDIIIDCLTKKAGVAKVPGIRLVGISHLPRAGQVIEWKGEKYVVTQRSL